MILVTQNNDKYEVRFNYDPDVVTLVKNVPGRVWHPEQKFWSIPLARLGFLIAQLKGTKYERELQIQSNEDIDVNASLDDPNAIPDIDVSDVTWYVQDGCYVFNHQKDTVRFAKWRYLHGLRSGFMLADEPGCISGDAVVKIREEGKGWTRDIKLHRLFELFEEGHKFKIKALVNGRFEYMPVRKVIDSGVKRVITIKTDEHSLTCTPDHLLYTPTGWIQAQDLSIGDQIFHNGQLACPKCGTTSDLVGYKYSKYYGYCRKCMYKMRRTRKCPTEEVLKEIDSHGYVRLFGRPTYFWPLFEHANGEGIYEHHQVWYENTGHIIDTKKEAIHHINHIKTDNRFENLQLVSHSEHGKLHAEEAKSHLPQNTSSEYYFCKGAKQWLVPKASKVIDIIDEGCEEHVYDVSIDDIDIHNFIANNFIVHNCGKSLSVCLWAMYMKEKYQAKHCLIIACVNSAKYNWQEDIKKHTNGKEVPYILGSRRKRDGSINLSGSSQDKLDDLTSMTMYGNKSDEPLPYFIILNIEAVRMRSGKKYPIADRLIELINLKEIAIVALDEIHRGASASSLQGKQLFRIKKEVKEQIQWIPMTGTPITSKPTDVFLPLRLVDGHEYSSYYAWCQKYCIYGGFGGHEIIGYKNIPELKSILQPNMLRRLKRDILDLPPKIHYTEYIENTSYQQKLYDKIRDDLISGRGEIVKSLNPLSKFLHLRQVNGNPELVDLSLDINSKEYLSKNAKLARLLELLDDILAEPDEKVVIFSNWVEPLKTLHKYVSKKYKVCCYTGTMKPDDREKHKQAFINNPERRIMLGTVGALGTSHTLTVARNVIFYDSPWNPADIEQAEDRCHRPGTKDSVFVYTLITKGTVDEKVHQILSRKEGTAQYIVDNELDLHSHPELFDLLLGGSNEDNSPKNSSLYGLQNI